MKINKRNNNLFNHRNSCLRRFYNMKSIIKIIIIFTAVLIIPEFVKCQDDLVKIGVLAKRGKERCLEKWSPTAEYLTNQIPECTFIIVPLDFDEVQPAVKLEKVDFVIVNPYYFVELEVMYGINRIVTLKNLLLDKVCTVYGGVIFCRNDRKDIKELDDLMGKSFMAPYERAFGGWASVLRVFHGYGINPYHDFTEVRFGGTQDAVVYAVRDGKVDAGSVKTDVLERISMEGKISIEEFKIINEQVGNEEFPFIHSTRLYPEWSFAKLKHTSIEMAEKAGIALLAVAPDSPAARAGRYAGWAFPLNYQSVHECLKELHLGPYNDFGKVTIKDVFKQYWYWIIIVLIFLIIIIIAMIYVIHLNKKLRDYQDQLRSLTSELSLIAEKERRRIATELHDRIGQNLSLSKIKMDVLQKSISSIDLKESLKKVINLIGDAIKDTRSLTFDLSPPVLYELGFDSALKWLSNQIHEEHGIYIEFESEKVLDQFDNDINIILFQSVRELLINVIKHARAHRVKVSVKKKNGEMLIKVEDDGIGFKPSTIGPFLNKTNGFGLFSIRERLDGFGGILKVESKPDRGTQATIIIPSNQRKK